MHAKSSAYHELVEAMCQPGCPVCRLVDRAVRQYVDVFFYENITSVERRAEIREARGYCSAHGALLAGHARMLGIAIVQHDVINDVLREINRLLRRTEAQHRPPGRLIGAILRRAVLGAIRPKRVCPLCEYERNQEHALLYALVTAIRDDALSTTFARSSGLCLPHVRSLLQLRGLPPDRLRQLLQIERDILTALKADLEEYLAKSNGSYDYVGMGKEADSPLRAIKLVSGRVLGQR